MIRLSFLLSLAFTLQQYPVRIFTVCSEDGCKVTGPERISVGIDGPSYPLHRSTYGFSFHFISMISPDFFRHCVFTKPSFSHMSVETLVSPPLRFSLTSLSPVSSERPVLDSKRPLNLLTFFPPRTLLWYRTLSASPSFM